MPRPRTLSHARKRLRLPCAKAFRAAVSTRSTGVAALLVCGFADLASGEQPTAAAAAPAPAVYYIQEYRVTGAKALPRVDVENAVYPFLGPGRTEADVEQARAALEKVYQDKGLQTVSVQVPPQSVRNGIVVLQVVENKVGRLRVKGSRFFLPSQIKGAAPSLAEGSVPNFNDVQRDIIALNQLPDRRVTPELRPGVEPGTVDIDLTVKDTFPLHGSVELNNRYSANTTPLRLNASLSYNNLWQLGHSIGASVQVSPEDLSEVKVFSGFYIARFPAWGSFSLLLQGTKQESNVATLGSVAVAGNGESAGARGIWTLPGGKDFYHSLSAGFDYKHFDQRVVIGADGNPDPTATTGANVIDTPLTYFPLSAVYTATWAPKGAVTELNMGVTLGLRGLGSGSVEFENNRFRASGGFISVRGDLSHTHDLPFGFQAFGKVQGQISDQPLVSSEQFGGGGLGTARGYLEAEVLGDNAIFGTLELRSPSLLAWLPERWKGNEWRLFAFADAGGLSLHSPLPEQESSFRLASFGGGTRIRLLDHLNGSLDAGVPLISQTETRAGDVRVTFRMWGDF